MSSGPSPHLSWKELACKDDARTPYPEQWMDTRAVVLAREFETIRAAVGRPILILSAYRTEAHNRKIGGARDSQHVQGRALDLRAPTGWTLERFYGVIRGIAMTKDSKLFGLGLYGVFVHIDVRPKPEHGRLIAWHGERAWADLKA